MGVEQERPCRDPECGGVAEPEDDGVLRWWACTTCGYEFGWQQLQQPDAACQLGIPEEVRRRAVDLSPLTRSPEFQERLSAAAREAGEVFLGQIGRRPE